MKIKEFLPLIRNAGYFELINSKGQSMGHYNADSDTSIAMVGDLEIDTVLLLSTKPALPSGVTMRIIVKDGGKFDS